MLDMIFSEWIVRGFLLYLLIAGILAVIFRERAAMPLNFALVFLPVIAEKWGCRWSNHRFFRPRWGHGSIHRLDESPQTRLRLWSSSHDTGLRYI
jgi:hypothetical protein